MNYEMDRVSIRMVKEPPLLSEKPITGPESAIEVLNDYLGEFDREVMAIVNLRTDGKPINMNIMSMGTINSCYRAGTGPCSYGHGCREGFLQPGRARLPCFLRLLYDL